MSKLENKQSEREKQAQLKALREELSSEIKTQLEGTPFIEEKRPEKNERVPSIQSESEAKRVIEALLFTSGRPIMPVDLKRSLGSGFSESKIQKLILELQAEYVNENRSFRIVEVAGGYECSTDPKFAPWILKMELQKK